VRAPIWATPDPQNNDTRQIIYLDEEDDDIDFVTLHNILYYIYTGHVNLYNDAHGSKTLALPVGSPAKPDPFRLSRNADKFLLPALVDRCRNHIHLVLTPEMVVEKLFSTESQRHQGLRNVFLDFLLQNFDKVKKTKEWEQVMSLEEDVDPSLLSYRLRTIFEITQESQIPPENKRRYSQISGSS
jgi:hypothetical protein